MAPRKPIAAGPESVAPVASAPQPTPAADWGAHLYTLPSGKVARLRRPSLLAMIARGSLPNPVAAKLHRLLTSDDVPTSDEERLAQYAKTADTLVEIASLAFVEPRLILDRAPDYGNGEIGPFDLADRDLTWIYYTLTQGADDESAPFRLD